MDVETLAREIAIAQSKLDKLQQQAQDGAASPFDLQFARTMTAELGAALDHVLAVEDEIEEQSEQLERAVDLRGRQRYQQLFDTAPIAYLLTNTKGIILEANRAAGTLLATSPAYMLKKPLVVYIPKKHQAAFYARLEQVQQGDAILEWETQFRPRDQPHVDVIVAVSLTRSPGGEPTIQWAVQNITDRKRAEEKINEQNRQLTGLNIFNTVISSTLDLPAMFAALEHLIREQLAIPGGIILSASEPGQPLRVETSWGLGDELVKAVQLVTFGNSSTEPTSTADGVVFAENRRNALLALVQRGDKAAKWHANLSLEFTIDGEVNHSLDLFSPDPAAFEGDQMVFLETLAQQVAIGVRKAALFARVRSLSRQLIHTQERERRELARELHDEIGQQLTGLKLLLETPASSGNSTDDKVRKATDAVNQLIGQVRTLSLNLRPAMLDDLGLLPSLLWYFQRYTEQSQIYVNFQHSGLEQRLGMEVETAAYRIVQEALTNVARHAQVKEVTVRAWVNPHAVYLQIKDDGTGFDLRHTQTTPTSSGVNNMMERAALLHGRLEIDTTPGAGTSITVELPCL